MRWENVECERWIDLLHFSLLLGRQRLWLYVLLTRVDCELATLVSWPVVPLGALVGHFAGLLSLKLARRLIVAALVLRSTLLRLQELADVRLAVETTMRTHTPISVRHRR